MFNSIDFQPAQYAQTLTQKCIGIDELIKHRQSLSKLLDETNDGLKKNVYQNFMTFINNSEEISHLGNEMKELSKLLMEQKDELTSLSNLQIIKDDVYKNIDDSSQEITHSKDFENEYNENRIKKLKEIMNEIEECPNLLEFDNCQFLHDEKLLELHPLENTPLRRIHGYLFSKHLLICSLKSNRNNSITYKFQSIYKLETLAVINIKEMGNIKAAFKIMSFPETRVFQCVSTTSKKKWLELFDKVKKGLINVKNDKNIDKAVTKSVLNKSESIDSTISFEEPNELSNQIHHPEWFLETSDDLDVLIAQRQFEEAFHLFTKSNEYIVKNSTIYLNDIIFNDIKKRIENRKEILIESLKNELSPNRSLHSDLRLMRKPIKLLSLLNCSSDACNLFLNQCSCIFKQQYKRIKRDCSTFVYIQQLSSLFCINLTLISEQFSKFFPEVSESDYIKQNYFKWASDELNVFIKYFNEQVFVPQNSHSTITDCITESRTQIEQIKPYGAILLNTFNKNVQWPINNSN